MITLDFLEKNGVKTGSEEEGTVIHYTYNNINYTVLQDNTVIFRCFWDKQEA